MKWLLSSLIVFLIFVLPSSNVLALTYPPNSIGEDISWPNCGKLTFNPSAFGVVGVNGGLDFHNNPCIGEEASLYKNNLSLYVNTGYPGKPYIDKYINFPFNCSYNNQACWAYNYGFNAGKFSINYSLSHGVVSNNWWLDVETINSWSTNAKLNRAALNGEIDAINQSLKPVVLGIYSFPPEWKSLTNNWQINLSNWVATNSNYLSVAKNQCTNHEFTADKTVLTQYIGKLDYDLTC